MHCLQEFFFSLLSLPLTKLVETGEANFISFACSVKGEDKKEKKSSNV